MQPFVLELSDPLWAKLDSGFRVQDIPALLGELALSWDEDEADFLLNGELWHQGSCFGTAYPAVPHLLEIADRPENRAQRREIAIFLAQLALDSRRQHGDDPSPEAALQGLPETLEGWERKLDCIRDLAQSVEDPAAIPNGPSIGCRSPSLLFFQGGRPDAMVVINAHQSGKTV